MKRVLLVGIFLLVCAYMVVPQADAQGLRRKPPGPTLVAPGDDEDITGKEAVEFRWSPEGDRSNFDHYDFRLYKGHQTVEAGLILQRKVPSGENSTRVEASIFQDGQTYAWSVRQVGARKSRSSFSVFKAIKRG